MGCTLKSYSVSIFQSKDFRDDCIKYNSELNFLRDFYNLDSLTQALDQLLCSDECRCHIKDTTTTIDIQSLKTGGTAYNVLDCPKQVLSKAINSVLANNSTSFGFLDNNITLDEIFEYLKVVEKRHNCAGFCPSKGEIKKYQKYIFSDINNGKPNDGCLMYIDEYNPNYIKIFNLFSIISNISFFIYIVTLSILVYLDLNYLIEEDRKSKDDADTQTDGGQYSTDIFSYENPEDNNSRQNLEDDDDDDSSSESDEIEFDTDDEDDSIQRNSGEIELTDVIG